MALWRVASWHGRQLHRDLAWWVAGNCTVTLHGTNLLLSAIHGENPRETPGYVVGKEALLMDGGMLGVMGTFIAKGSSSSPNQPRPSVLLAW